MSLAEPGWETTEKPAFILALGLPRMFLSIVLVELSGIEPLTSSLRIQGATLEGEIPDDTE